MSIAESIAARNAGAAATLVLLLSLTTAGSPTPAWSAPPAAPAAHAPARTGSTPPLRPTTAAQVLAASAAADWRRPDPQDTLYLELPAGRVVLELSPQFAPRHTANILALVRGGFFDGLTVERVQDNYVVQWGDPDGTRPVGAAQRTLPAEFERALSGLAFQRLPDTDTYAPLTGFAAELPAAADPAVGRAWPVHCYGAVGVGRDNDVDSGGGTELYVVIGQAPRHLDRNITVVGRVLSGMELLSALPRGTGPLGFYEKPEQRLPIRSVRIAADVPAAQRSDLEVLRTGTATFAAWVEARRNRREEWFKVPAGHVDVCNLPIPVRQRTHG
ncbi:MAG: peptidylprolyl isomerase [Proteobacteria bacterium]|nr:peptidylprolyl isomerase [Pseudomonadota bacterium]